jgi:hypothetical protein
MNYAKHYQALMDRAEGRTLVGYSERHHVVPKCLDKSSKRTVRLTPEEHYVAHQLLTRMYPDSKGLVYAAVRMTQGSNNGTRSNKMYGWLRREWMKVITQPWSAKRRAAQTPEVNARLSAAHLGQIVWNKGRKLEGVSPLKGVPKSEEHKANLRQPKSEETKEKLRLASLAFAAANPGRKHTPETIAKLIEVQNRPDMRARNSASNKGRRNSPDVIARMIEAQNRSEVKENNRQRQLARSDENSAAQVAAWAKKNADPETRAAISLQRKESAKRSWAERKAADALLSPELRAQKEIMRLQKLIADLKAQEKEESA